MHAYTFKNHYYHHSSTCHHHISAVSITIRVFITIILIVAIMIMLTIAIIPSGIAEVAGSAGVTRITMLPSQLSTALRVMPHIGEVVGYLYIYIYHIYLFIYASYYKSEL